MTFLSRLKSILTRGGPSPQESWRSLIRPIGLESPQCPYCGHAFESMPKRKRKCPECGRFFHSRKRPVDGVKVLLTQEEAEEQESQAAIQEMVEYGGAPESGVNSAIAELRRSSPNGVTIHQVLEHLLRWRADEAVNQSNWGIHRSARFKLGTLFLRQDRASEALEAFLEVCYLDLNGPRNSASTDPQHLARFPPFEPAKGSLFSGVLTELERAVRELGLSTDEVCDRFTAQAVSLQRSWGLPRSPEEACSELRAQLARSTDGD